MNPFLMPPHFGLGKVQFALPSVAVRPRSVFPQAPVIPPRSEKTP